MSHPSEAGHWYDRTGKPCYSIIGKNGKERPTTIRDARANGWLPSVTGIIRCAAAPGLTNWMIDQAILAALTLPMVAGESSEGYLARIKQDSKEQARKAAERGTAIHAAIQGAYEGEAYPSEMYVHIAGAMAQVDTLKPISGWWTPERSFAAQLGFGGKVDLSCGNGVIDFKTKEFGPDADLKTWDEHAMQLAAYRHGLRMENARCAICYVSVTNPGLSRLIEIPEEELQRGWECFVYLLGFWKAKNRFNSAYDIPTAQAA